MIKNFILRILSYKIQGYDITSLYKKIYFFQTCKLTKTFICIFLLLSTFAVYSQVQDHAFLNLDDPIYISENPNLKDGLSLESVIWAFTTSYDGNWFPLTWISHLLDYQLFGLSPKGHHLSSLLFHIANALLLFLVLLRMTGALWKSSFVALLFALHPLNIESVAWVSERKNVLSAFFWMLTLWAYTSYIYKPEFKRYLILTFFFVLGLMSKAMLVTLPFVLLLLDYWPLRRFINVNRCETSHSHKPLSFYYLIIEKVPLLVLSFGSSITTFIVQKFGGAVQSDISVPLKARIINAFVSYINYLKMMIWPKGMAILYPHPGTLPSWQGVVCAMVLLFITILVLQRVKSKPYLAIGWFWYLGTLVPVIGLVQVGVQAMADRYSYIPLIGIFITVAWGLPELVEEWGFKNKVLIFLALTYIPVLMLLTWTNIHHWKNSISIFRHAISVTEIAYPDFAIVHNNLGRALRFEHRKEAIHHYNMAIQINPKYALAYYNLGNALYKERRFEEAVSHFQTTIKLQPDFYIAHYNLGTLLIIMRRFEEGIHHFKMAIKYKPDFPDTHFNLGAVLLSQHNTVDAIIHYKAAINLKPNFPLAHLGLGHALYKELKYEDAILHYRIAIKQNPNLALAHDSLDRALNQLEQELSLQ
jgi:protein O-mannosyl-transferase